jgi:hypothetical protein
MLFCIISNVVSHVKGKNRLKVFKTEKYLYVREGK